MDYIIPDNIKLLCAKDDLSDSKEQELVKRELAKFLTAYLTLGDENDNAIGRNSLANITDIVSPGGEFPVKGTVYPFERDVAGRMVRTRNYTMKEGVNKAGKEEVYVIAADRDWWDKYRVRLILLTAGISAFIGIMTDPLKGLLKNESNNHYLIRDTIQVRLRTTNSTLNQSDTTYNLPIVKKDSIDK